MIGSNNGLSPGRRQAIIWINAGMLLIRPFGTFFSEILIEIHTFSFNKTHLKMSSGKCRSQPQYVKMDSVLHSSSTYWAGAHPLYSCSWSHSVHGRWSTKTRRCMNAGPRKSPSASAHLVILPGGWGSLGWFSLQKPVMEVWSKGLTLFELNCVDYTHCLSLSTV